MIKFRLDGREIEMAPGATILTAARTATIDIPTFCYLDRLSILASCRMCLVEIEGRGKLEPACSTVVAENMVIHTRSERVVAAREDMLEILLANHPLDCPICDKGGECELQDTVFEYGKGDSRFHDTKRVFRTRDIELNNVIVFNADRCIQCQRCVRVCEEIVGEVALGTAERGLDSEITGVGNSLKDCSHCGNCIEVCPVGALMSTPYRYRARPWDMVQTDTICGMCGTGCSMTIETRDGELMRVKSKYETGINGELLCAKGRFGFDIIDSGERIREPMVRKNGILTPVSWDEAVGFIADTAKNIRQAGGHMKGLISPRQTNETAYMFQKLMRTVLKSHDIHSSCRFGGLGTRGKSTLKALARVMACRYSREPLQTVLNADCIILLGANITEENPVTGYLIRETIRDRNNQLLIASSRPCGLDDIAVESLPLLPGFEACLLYFLTAEDPPPGNDDFASYVASSRPIIAAADSVTLLVGSDFLRSSEATNCLAWIEKAARLIEADGKKVFVQFLFDRPNQLGLWDMGCLPGISPGWQDVDETVIPAAFSGCAVPDLFYVLGADPVRSCADGDPCEGAAMKTGCLVVQDSHMTKTAEMAAVVLPAPSYGEETGTYTNNEGRVQKLQAVRSPETSVRSTIKVFNLIAASMESKLGPDGVEQVFGEIAVKIPGYQELADWELDNDFGLTTALPSVDVPVVAPEPVFWLPSNQKQGYSLITGDSLFHSGLLSARSEILSSLSDGPYVEMNPGDGYEKFTEGYDVTVTRNGATITARLKVNKAIAEGFVYVPENLLSLQKSKLLCNLDYPCTVDVKIVQNVR